MLMNQHFPIPRSRGAGSGFAEITRTLTHATVRALFWPVRAIKGRQHLLQLSSLSDRELSDIGLTRQDLHNATALPADSDPTRFLADTVCSRTSAMRARYY